MTRTPRPICACGCGRETSRPDHKYARLACFRLASRKPKPICACGCGAVCPRTGSTYASQACRVAVLRHPRPPCACGCGQPVTRAGGTYAKGPSCTRARVRRAGDAARASYRRQVEARAERFATKGTAFAAGYKSGWLNAWRWWKRKYARDRGRAA